MRKLYDEGKKLRDIQAAFDHEFSRGSIANYLHADGGHVRPRGRVPSSGGT